MSGLSEEDKNKVETLLDFDNNIQIEKIYNKAKELNCEILMELDKIFWELNLLVSKINLDWIAIGLFIEEQ
ncbi:MAG: hypothetical protein HGN29_16630 [Asgard group archaeon]|nr:hypothetical protein [Asgard group archaeon]